MSIKKCPDSLPKELTELIVEFGKRWAACPERPTPSEEFCSKWECLLQEWVKDEDLPLFVRKTDKNRGHKILHESSGRFIVPTDNSPAQWVFTMACENNCPTIDDLRAWLIEPSPFLDKVIPIAWTLSKIEKETPGYKKTLTAAKGANVNIQGWKLGHIKSIGLGKQGELCQMDIKNLTEHHMEFLRPSNMFVIPKQWGGLAEIQEVADAMSGYGNNPPIQ